MVQKELEEREERESTARGFLGVERRTPEHLAMDQEKIRVDAAKKASEFKKEQMQKISLGKKHFES